MQGVPEPVTIAAVELPVYVRVGGVEMQIGVIRNTARAATDVHVYGAALNDALCVAYGLTDDAEGVPDGDHRG